MDLLGFELDILTIIVFVPLIGAAVVGMVPAGNARMARWLALLFSGSVVIPSIVVFVEALNADLGMNEYVYQSSTEWFSLIGSSWHVGVDGISAPMILLTALLSPLAIAIAFEHDDRANIIMALFLLLQSTMFGVFVTLDMLVFFLFYELGLVPMYFIIYLWGGENRRLAARKFFLVTMFAGLGLLLSIQLVAVAVGQEVGQGITFDIPTWQATWPQMGVVGDTEILGIAASGLKWFALLGFTIAFAIKIPVWPLHTWLPDAHTEAPTAGSMILAGVLLKLGAYGFLRVVIPIFPLEWVQERSLFLPGADIQFLDFQFTQLFALLATLSIVFGAFSAWGQDDFKKLVAYSSVNHMGFVAMGLAVFAAVYGANYALSLDDRPDLVASAVGQSIQQADVDDFGDGRALADLTSAEQGQIALLKLQNLKTDEEQGFEDIVFTCGEVTFANAGTCAIEAFPRITGDQQNAIVAGNGAVMQMFNHGLSAAGMFLLVGALYHKAHTRDLRRFGGLWHTIPIYGAVLVFMSMASLGLPGLNGFIGEYLVVAGSFPVQGFEWYILISMIGLLITGAYILKGLQKVLHGPPNPEWQHYHEHHHSLEISWREGVVVAPLMILIFVTGVFPNWILPVINDSVSAMFTAFVGG